MLKIVSFIFYLIVWHLTYASIMDVLTQDKRFETLVAHIEHFELIQFMNDLDGVTLFTPDNDAFKNYEFKIDRSTLLYHVIKKGMKASEFYDGQLKETFLASAGHLNPDRPGQRIKFNVKEENVYCGGEAKIIEKDIPVNNSTWIQVVDHVLQPPHLLGNTILERNKPLYNLMNLSKTIDILNQKRPFTVFVSTKNDIFEKFNEIEHNYLTSKYAIEDLAVFFNYTIIDKAIFMNEFTSGKTTYKSLSGDSLVIVSDKKSMTVNGIPIRSTDIIASNGVIHEISDTFKPDIQFDARKYLYGMNKTYMIDWIEQHNLGYLNHSSSENYTYLIPPLESVNQSLVSTHWLSYHILEKAWLENKLRDNTLLKTEFKSDDLAGHRQRLPVYVQHEDIMTSGGKSIIFDKSRMIGDNVSVNGDVIYQISEPLTMPGNIFKELAVDLDLSTFIAVLYVSGIIEEIKQVRGLTLFVPTNNAFTELGLVAKYLVHLSARSRLQALLRHHILPTPLYYHDFITKDYKTLANTTLHTHRNKTGVVIGDKGIMTSNNLLVSTGVVHQISQVQIPFEITNTDVLVGIEEAKTMVQVLKRANLWEEIQKSDHIILTPTDEAFAHLDLDRLLDDPYQLDRIARFHIVPHRWQSDWNNDYATLLSKVDKIVFKGKKDTGIILKVKHGSDHEVHVTELGHVYGGSGVMMIDTVLIPIRRGFFGLPFFWSVVVLLTLLVLMSALLGVVGFFAYKIYHRRRLGYRPIY